METGAAFRVEKLSISFGGLKAVSDFSLDLPSRSIHGLIGPNGAGKTTCFNLITGVYKPDSGRMFLGERSLLGLSPHQITKAGLARTFQNIRLFSHLTSLENVLISFHMRVPYGYVDTLLRSRKFRDAEADMKNRAKELLDLMGLGGRAHDEARNLSYGDQRRLEIARALATRPQVLFLDEPAAGLNSGEKIKLMHTIADIRSRFQLSILLI